MSITRVDEKRIKDGFKKIAGRDPEKYYPVDVLVEEGFERGICKNCGTAFWALEPKDACGEPECSGGYGFIGDSPALKKMDFIQTWQEFSGLFESLGYTPIKRYPVAARWRDDTDFVQASIYDFQPYVVSGEIDPPANPLVVPQFCLRFNDIDNVGFTGRHYTGFVMIGQHAFEPPEKYDPPSYLSDIYTWLIKGMGLPKGEIQFHEDTWAGGGNMGPSMEFFSRGLEIGNQVYMQYDIRSGTPSELSIKVLDMGMGQERPAWFTHGTATSYEANFGKAITKLYKQAGIKPDQNIVKKFLPYSGMLNFDEVDDIEKVWKSISKKIDIDLVHLKEEIVPLANLYSIADHSRSLLVALTDGALPSNMGGGYNLRSLLRRSLDFISANSWDIELTDVCAWHADYLHPQYPELKDQLDEVTEIIADEKRKHKSTRKKSKRIVSSLTENVSTDKLKILYKSQGITPQMLKDAGLNIDVPPDFYALISDIEEKDTAKGKTKRELKLPLEGIDATDILYYDDYLMLEFNAKVLKILDNKYVILNRTAFYPTSGGQLHDLGTIDQDLIEDIFNQGKIVVHQVNGPNFREGDHVVCHINKERRIQLAQHHTSTHIINGVSRKILGNHIWQAGAEKTTVKGRLDITHYEALSMEQLRTIEKEANRVIANSVPVNSMILKRDVAESRFGFRLYQGGAVPGRDLRVVQVNDLDVEACGGTHLQNTSEVGVVKMIRSTKIQDGIVRLEYVAGKAAFEYIKENIFKSTINLYESVIASEIVPEYNSHLANRLNDYKEIISNLVNDESFQQSIDFIQKLEGDLNKCAKIFSVPSENLIKTLRRFVKEIKIKNKELEKRSSTIEPFSYNNATIDEACNRIFSIWKKNRKNLASQMKLMDSDVNRIGASDLIVKRIDGDSVGTLKMAKSLASTDRVIVLFGVNEKISIVGLRGDCEVDMSEIVKMLSTFLGGKGGGRSDFGQGVGVNKEKIPEAIDLAIKKITSKLSS